MIILKLLFLIFHFIFLTLFLFSVNFLRTKDILSTKIIETSYSNSNLTTTTLTLENLEESDFTIYTCAAFWTNYALQARSSEATLHEYGKFLIEFRKICQKNCKSTHQNTLKSIERTKCFLNLRVY